ncbi:MAG: adenylyltransferase/cytidyltransferase family protein [Elusimicrobiota bacterium]|jgi:D-beta-D-heptose 7-phosphate kinase/D-beta-D-heptose 1-phosphate adenosyltransferase
MPPKPTNRKNSVALKSVPARIFPEGVSTSDKVLPPLRAAALRKQWARQGLRVVFTNGVFDLLHPGHIEVLEKAASLGDRLIVGVNSDASARRLGKGPERPLNPVAARMRVLAALSCVDAATPFSEDTPERLLSTLKPDILVKGGDYRPEQVAGRQYAGKVAIIPLKKGFSTTSLVKKIRRAG